ncbi:MAG TPA: PQQ-dependent sugar dehydrogenase [Phycisphaerales bacterium]|nr:PQQ-dependent sugar dehydrogenase [Phycisphaerales bacterium]
MNVTRQGLAAVCWAVACAAGWAQQQQPVEGMPWQPIAELRTEVVYSAPTIWCGSPPGDATRLIVMSQGGTLRTVSITQGPGGSKVYTTLPTPFLTPVFGGMWRSMAFAPDYAQSGYFYIARADLASGVNGSQVVRYRRSATNPDVADPASATSVIQLPGTSGDHAVGSMHFGADGMLYIGLGDSGGLPQSLTQLAGKMLRIDPSRDDFPLDPLRNYGIPAGNPYPISTATNAPRPEIAVVGVRNPWRWSFDRETGRMWIGDVGGGLQEEVSVLGLPSQSSPATGVPNLGWPRFEGFVQNTTYTLAPRTVYRKPALVYQHLGMTNFDGRLANVNGRSITGGFVYRGNAIPSLRGNYLFADYVSQRAWASSAAQPWVAPRELTQQLARLRTGGLQGLGGVVSFGEDADGELYICTLGSLGVRKIVAAAVAPPPGLRAEPGVESVEEPEGGGVSR